GRLGLSVTVSPAASDRHGRIHLDRAYLEVSAAPTGAAWDVTHVFLRFSDPEGLRLHLDRAGIAYRFDVYEGVDGRWDDVTLDAAGVPVPILVRRTEPAEVARHWPPPLDLLHRCGATTLAEVHVPVPAIGPAIEIYRRLLGVDAPSVLPGAHRRAVFRLPGSRIELVEGGERRAVVLGVSSLEEARDALGPVVPPVGDRGVAWLDPSATEGLVIGLREHRRRYRR
ncbi:MAG TPA: hypothetical protein VE669_05045, partial [Actinomycetota bacterium]|nr:hypothetical protein [Actinomycetota bacterium]